MSSASPQAIPRADLHKPSRLTWAVARALVVDDDVPTRDLIATLLKRRGIRPVTAPDGQRAVTLLEGGLEIDVVLLDVKLPGISGIETLRRMRESHPLLPAVMVSGCDDVATVMEAARLGVVGFVSKPFDEEELLAAVGAALAESDRLLQMKGGAPGIRKPEIWDGSGMREMRALVEQVADSDASVIVRGETGVGKEIVAQAIHARSPRAQRPLVKVACAALPSQLLESELFGYEKGAFTDAWSQKRGKFELADGGTIFLDEIGEISTELQPKLLQVLQDREVYRIGSNVPIPTDARIVCATHRPLDEMVREGLFRADLFYRLNVVQIRIPPLRERRDEIPVMFDAFVCYYASKYDRPLPSISTRLRRFLERWTFPGNVRELENLAKRVVVLGEERTQFDGGRSPEMRLADEFADTAGSVPLLEVRRRVAREVERAMIERALDKTGWNRREAARRLNLSYSTMLQKIKECVLEDAIVDTHH